MVNNSSEVANNYLEEVRNSIESDILLVHLDVNAKPSLFYENPKRFAPFYFLHKDYYED